jgi:cytochrome c556
MPNRLTLLACALVAAGTLGASGLAVAQPKPEQLIEYRQSVYQVLVWNFGPMGAAVQGKIPFDKDAFAKQAARVATMAPMAAEGFARESLAANSDAKPEIWKNKAEFDKLMQNLVTKTAALAEVSKSGDLAKIRPAFGEAAQACKACHDKFKKD